MNPFNKTKKLTYFSIILLINNTWIAHFVTPDSVIADFNGKIFDLSGIIAVPDSIDATSAERFAALAEQTLATINSFNPLTDVQDFDLFQFNKTLRRAKDTASTNPVQTKITRINTVYDKLNKFMTDHARIDLSGISSLGGSTGGGGITTTTGYTFKQLSTYTSERYRYLQNLGSMTQLEATNFANEVLLVVQKEAAGIIDATQISSIKSRLRSILTHKLITAASTVVAIPSNSTTNPTPLNPGQIIQSSIDFIDRITMTHRIDFLDRIWDDQDNVFETSDGETRFLTVVDYVIQRFTTLTSDQKDDLYSILDEASVTSTFSDNTRKVVGNLLKTQDWFGTTTTNTGTITDTSTGTTNTGTTATPPILTISELRSSIETAAPALSTKLVSLSSESAYEAFLTDLETTVSNYRQLVESGEIKLVPAAGTVRDPMIATIEGLAERVLNNYRFQRSPYKERATNIYNLAKGNLSLEQKLDRFQKGQASVQSDNDAIAFVTRIKNDLVYNEDGSPKAEILRMTDDKKTLLINYITTLQSADFFGAAGQDLSNMITTIRSGVVIDQLISDVASKLNLAVDTPTLNTFMIAIRNLKTKFDEFRAKGIITDDQQKKMIDLIASTQTGKRYWPIQSGVIKVELANMLASLKNPLSLANKIVALKNRLATVQNNPDSVTLSDLEGIKNQIDAIVNEWNLARVLGLSEAAQNTDILAMLDLFVKSDEFYDYRTAFTTMINTIKSTISRDQKVGLIFSLMDSVQNATDPAPKLIDNFVLSAKLLSNDLSNLNAAQRTALQAHINSARLSDKFIKENKDLLLSYENKIKDFEAKNTTTSTSTTSTTGTTTTTTNTSTNTNSGSTTSTDGSTTSTGGSTTTTGGTTTPTTGTVPTRGTPASLSMSRGRAPVQGGAERVSSYQPAAASPSMNTRTRNVSAKR